MQRCLQMWLRLRLRLLLSAGSGCGLCSLLPCSFALPFGQTACWHCEQVATAEHTRPCASITPTAATAAAATDFELAATESCQLAPGAAAAAITVTVAAASTTPCCML